MFKKREKPQTRQRDADDGDDIATGGAKALKQRRLAGGENLIAASTKKGEEGAAEALTRKEETTALRVSENDKLASFAGSAGGDATRTLEIDTDRASDVRAMHERNQKIHEDLKAGTIEAGIYRGLGGYKQYMEKGEGAIANSKYSGLLGPTRGMTQVRMTMNIEYWGTSGQGGVCKDYKETGFCGYGDSCKFMHDRSDYKSGFQLDKEWEEQQKEKQRKLQKRLERRLQRKTGIEEGDSDANDEGDDASERGSSDDEGLPFACFICREKWEDCSSDPIQTICGHYFCENCAMEQFAQTSRCSMCGSQTNGIFNGVDSLIDKAKARKQQKASAASSSSTGGAGEKPAPQDRGRNPIYGKNLDDDAGELEAELTKGLGANAFKPYRSARRDGMVGST